MGDRHEIAETIGNREGRRFALRNQPTCNRWNRGRIALACICVGDRTVPQDADLALWISRGRGPLNGLIHANQGTTFGGIAFRQKAIDGNAFREAWIGYELVTIRKGELERFGHDMDVVCRVVAELPQIESFQNVQSNKQHNALGVWSALKYFIFLVG